MAEHCGQRTSHLRPPCGDGTQRSSTVAVSKLPGMRTKTSPLGLGAEYSDASRARSLALMNGKDVTSILARPCFTVAALNLRSPDVLGGGQSVGARVLWP